ncbi:hypothetical protein [Saccharibacillus qingshengii]|uniref:hypothetical protein n=1 Tax=Saccharibacillus qingshengii TaxID=1763540 RepID=UPI0015520674|nr:hypothetical protein [Saccharibacillus qingshengii]
MEAIRFGGRLQIDKNWTLDEIRLLAAEPSLRILQYSEREVPGPKLLELLDEELFAVRPDIELRIYGFHLQAADLSVLERLPEVVKLSVDCCSRAEGLSHIGSLAKLRELTLDVFELDSFEVLGEVRSGLERLRLGKTRSKKPDLAILSRFSELEELILAGQRKHLGVLHELKALRALTVYGIPLGDLSFLGGNPQLNKLSLGFGGAEDLGGLHKLDRLEKLSLTGVRGLSRLDVLSALPRLRELKLRDQPKLATLPDFSDLPELRAIQCWSIALDNLDWTAGAEGLEEFAFLEVKTLGVEDFRKLFALRRPKRIRIVMNRAKEQEAIRRLMVQEGFTEESGGWWSGIQQIGEENAK